MEIIREEDVIKLIEGETKIEEYKFDSEINFSKLIEHLLSLNLSDKIQLKDSVENKKTEEENLIKIIDNIITDYNNKVGELIEFKKTYLKKDDSVES